MAEISARKRIWGWMMFDWASQPYNTLLLTFIFGPYFAEIVSERLMAGGATSDAAKASAQAYWGYGLAASGLFIAFLAPILGAIADSRQRHMPWIWIFSVLYVIGAGGLWTAHPDNFSILGVLIFFGIGLIGMEFATIFTNAVLPSLGDRHQIGAISGNGWALGYVGGVLALIVMLLLLAENGGGVTFIGIEPILGLDPETREGTRSVGPLTAIWYVVFMVPFFMWVREKQVPFSQAAPIMSGLRDLKNTLKSLPGRPSMASYLASSMFYRDSLNGIYTFGGIYAFGVLGWTVVDIGVFGILAAISGAIFAWVGGQADKRFGSKPVIVTCILILLVSIVVLVTISRESVLFMSVAEGSSLPDIAYYFVGIVVGAAGGALQASSRTMMVHQSHGERMTEAFGLYALAGKATTFIAPVAIGIASDLTGSQRLGVTPLIALFLVGLILLVWVKPDGDKAPQWPDSPQPSS